MPKIVDSVSSLNKNTAYETSSLYKTLAPPHQPEKWPVDTFSTVKRMNESVAPQDSSWWNVSSIVDLGKKVWNWLCSTISWQKDSTAIPGKPAGDNTQPIGGTPVLTTPSVLIDKEMLEKLIQELQQQSQRITETLNEADEQIKEDERRILHVFAQQMKVREEGIESLKFQIVFDQKKGCKIHREHYSLEGETIAVDEKNQFWSKLNTGISIASVIVLTAVVAAAIFAASQGTATPLVIKVGFTGSQIALSFMQGGSQIMKANLNSELGKLQGKSLNLRQIHVHLSFKVSDELQQMKADMNQVSQAVEMRKEITKNMRDTTKLILGK